MGQPRRPAGLMYRADVHDLHREATAAELEAEADRVAIGVAARAFLMAVAAHEPGEWRHRAACKHMDTGVFFPSPGARQDDVKAICETCPVRTECAEHALARTSLPGYWGGMSERQRVQERRRRRRSPESQRL